MKKKKEIEDLDRLRQDYLIEREISGRLRNATKEERRKLYKELYDEFYQKAPTFAVSTRESNSKSRGIVRQLRVLRPYINPETQFMEIGPGSCVLSFEVAKYVKSVYAVDVSEEIAGRDDCPENFKLIISNGVDVPLPEHTIKVAYSNQLMEHLHPDDALDQLRAIYRTLVPGGVYICITPNRIYGPSDVSRYFDETATGLHLKEYTYNELSEMMKDVGFSKVMAIIATKNMRLKTLCPVCILRTVENVFLSLPKKSRKRITSNRKIKRLLSIKLVAIK